MNLVLDIVEPQEGILFVTGHVDAPLAVGDQLISLGCYAPAKKRNKSPKRLFVVDVSLTIVSLIVNGESLDRVSADTTTQVGFTGDAEPVLTLLEDQHWHERNGRYHLPRNETRLIMLSGD